MKQYGLIGFPLGHSYSKAYFSQKFVNEQIEAEYLNFEIENIQDFPQLIEAYPDLRGLNVTKPHKEVIIPYLHEVDQSAAEIGAVNVVACRKEADGQTFLKGYNSDVVGFRESIRPLLNATHQKALLLGTGGAAKAAYQGLKQLGITPVYVSRTKQKNGFTYADLDQTIVSQHTVIVNATPLGMHPHTEQYPDIPYHLLTSKHLLFDLIYNPEETAFLRLGKEKGAIIKNGLEMLHLQAEAAWSYWND